MLSDLTDPGAVRQALAEYDELGPDRFLAKYGFGPARRYFVVYNGRRYDSKAIAGAAHGYQYPDRGPLSSADFSGGDATVAPTLSRLGFTVEDTGAHEPAGGSLPEALAAICRQLLLRHEGSPEFVTDHLSELIRKQAV